MKTIKNIENIIIINKSKFITNLIYVESINEIDTYLKEIKNRYKDATHHCYAYIIDNIKRFNDDSEPSGTAGIPILECLEKNDLNHVLCIVTRYFGGIKLGAGGLLRAYTNSVVSALNNTQKLELSNGYLIEIKFDYNESKIVDKLLTNYKIIDKVFKESITYVVECDDYIINIFKDMNFNMKILKNTIIKK